MAISYKRLGATTVAANTNTQLYVVPALTSTIVSSLVVANIGTSTGTFRVAIVEGAIGTVTNKDFIYYDISIAANDTFTATCGFTMATTNTILVRSNNTNIVFSAFGSEIS
jgi:hypothetical protein